MQELSYALCFVYAAATRSVSIPAPVYCACFSGRIQLAIADHRLLRCRCMYCSYTSGSHNILNSSHLYRKLAHARNSSSTLSYATWTTLAPTGASSTWKRGRRDWRNPACLRICTSSDHRTITCLYFLRKTNLISEAEIDCAQTIVVCFCPESFVHSMFRYHYSLQISP